MTDLHGWITQQVEQVESVARRASDCATGSRWEGIGSVLVTVPEDGTAGPDIAEATFHSYDDALAHAALHDPAAVLRRCEADRRILARHTLDPDQHAFPGACQGCGTDDWGLPIVEDLTDCPELLDLAHAHGITDEILASLDRPEPPPRPPHTPRPAPVWPTTPMADVPPALRGPGWKADA
ncbi:DUF6221 family protein [Streptomyces lavendofoliae]|uniref:Uncharacterized protein n=1 Tax=Streptomyces lavendofoliae TaxID=67314 RepID=A0A918I372_9ACTN|nr:DUF6221 family protein [Streptomyces lavendofoliae]GGU62704.1 hypothetical protein GCM10010274_59400 [Streptomyces lavendofoliae]